MLFRILKKDLKRKKGMNLILLLFVILVTVFTASGFNNIITVMTGVESFLDKANFKDLVALAFNGSEDEYAQALSEIPEIKDYTIERMYISGEVTYDNGEEKLSYIQSLLQTVSGCTTQLFDSENRELTAPEKGHIKVPYYVYNLWELKDGDTITLTFSGTEYSFEVEGWFKDALFGSQFMGTKRIILNESDYNAMISESGKEQVTGLLVMIETDDTAKVQSAISEKIQGASTYPRSTIKLCYVMDMIVAVVVLIASICLIAVSFIVLRFSIGFTVSEEFHEIGVMKAIGIQNRRIRLVYIIKYAGIAIAGCTAGFFLSFPLTDILLSSVSNNMVLESENPVFLSLLSAVMVALLITAFSWLSTAKVKKSTPVDAIRSGETGERYKKKTLYHLGHSHAGTASYLALNDILSSPKRYLTVLLSFLICTILVLMMVITCGTMEGDALCGLLCGEHDLYSGWFGGNVVENIVSDGSCGCGIYEQILEDTEDELEKLGIPGNATCDVLFSPSYTANGNTFSSYFLYGLGTHASDFEYKRGSAPQNSGEIAITEAKAEELGVDIGDTITVHYSTGDRNYIITGTFDMLINIGNCLRLYEGDRAVDGEKPYGCMAIGIDFDDSPDAETIEERKILLREHWGTENVWNGTELVDDNIGSISDTISAVKDLLLGITFAVVILVTVLTEKAFISNEKSQIAILKAIGFKNRRIILWHSLRFIFVGGAAVLLAALLSEPLTKLCVTPLYAMMGVSGMDFRVNSLAVFVIYPGAVLAVTAVVAFLTATGTWHTRARDTASNE